MLPQETLGSPGRIFRDPNHKQDLIQTKVFVFQAFEKAICHHNLKMQYISPSPFQ